MKKNTQIISAPSILGLKPTGVEKLPQKLLSNRLYEELNCQTPVMYTPTLNSLYSSIRDKENSCLNAESIKDFSLVLNTHIIKVLNQDYFPIVLGGDCSILLGILPGLKIKGNYGLIFCDAHADFYQPEKSTTGEVADMDLAIVTGRGPDILTNINDQKPYIYDKNVIHVGQRDEEETRRYGSQDIRETAIKRMDYKTIKKTGMATTIQTVIQHMNAMTVDGFWIHFDTDVLLDEENPAVDYRLPGGISFDQYKQLLQNLLSTNKIVGLSITIFNPDLDNEKETIAQKLTQLISQSFKE